jgi:NTE family protein
VIRSGARWLSLLSFGWLLRKWRAAPPTSLLDNTPLVGLLHRMLDLPRLDSVLSEGLLHALAVTASSYTGGNHVTFYQTAADIAPWVRMQRIALQDQIGVEHLLASSAIPFIFPAVPLYMGGHREYCGDGSMRQLAPISPAIHLGASKVLVVGAGTPDRAGPQRGRAGRAIRAWRRSPAMRCRRSSSTAGGRHRAPERVNKTLSMLPPELLEQTPLKPVEAAGDRAVRAARRYRQPPHRQPAGADPHHAVGHRRDRDARRGAGFLPAVRIELHLRVDPPRPARYQARKDDVLAFFGN